MTLAHRTHAPWVALAALLLALPRPADAQADTAAAQSDAATARRWELRITSGSLIPVGAQRAQLERASLSAIQVSWLPNPSLAMTGTFGWAKSRDLATAGTPSLNAFAADVGVESRARPRALGRRASLSPFAGLGAGARSYDYRSRRSDATHNVAAYAALGGELGVGRVGLRLEARQYVGGFAPMDDAGPTAGRSDVMVLASLRFNRHHTTR